MKHLLVLPLILQGCAALAPMADDLEKIETDNALEIKVQRGALIRDTNIHIEMDVVNKDQSLSGK